MANQPGDFTVESMEPDGERALPARRSRHPAGARYERTKLAMMEAPPAVVAGTAGSGAHGELTMKCVKAMKNDMEPRITRRSRILLMNLIFSVSSVRSVVNPRAGASRRCSRDRWSRRLWLGPLVPALLALCLVRASAADPSPASASPTFDAFRQEQLALMREREALASRNVTPAQMEAWLRQNAARLDAQRQRAKVLAAESAIEPLPEREGAQPIPADASPALRELLTTRAALANSRARIHNELVDQLPAEVSLDEVAAMQEREARLFAQRHAEDLKAQARRASALAAESARQPLPLPIPGAEPAIPPSAPPPLRAFLTARQSLMRERALLWNQMLTASPAARERSMLDWQKRNAARFESLRSLAREAGTAEPSPVIGH